MDEGAGELADPGLAVAVAGDAVAWSYGSSCEGDEAFFASDEFPATYDNAFTHALYLP